MVREREGEKKLREKGGDWETEIERERGREFERDEERAIEREGERLRERESYLERLREIERD